MNLAIWKRLWHAPFGQPVGLCILLQGSLMAIVNPLLPIVISDRIGLDKPQVTLFFVINTLSGIVITLGSGYLSDGTVSRYKLVVIGGTLGFLGNLAIAAATLPIHVFLAGPVAFAHMLLFPQLFAVAKAGIVADWEHEDQVMAITALRTLFSLGYILGTGLASGLAELVDIQAVFFLIAVAIAVLTIYAARVMFRIERFIAQRGTVAAAPVDRPLPDIPRGVILPLYALIVPLLALTVLQGAESTRRTYLSLVMFDIFDDASIAPLMFGITAAAELITMTLLGYVASKIGEKLTIVIGAGTGAVYFLIFSFVRMLPVLYFANVLYAVFVAALLGVAMAYIQGMLSHRAGLGGSLYVAVMNFGSLVGILSPLLTPGYEQTVFIIPTVLCVAGALLILFGDRTAQIEARLQQTAAQPAVRSHPGVLH